MSRATRKKRATVGDEKDEAGSQLTSLAEVTRRFAASGYDLYEHPAHIIRRAHQRATTCFQEVMNEKNLTPTQMAALATIMKHGELSQNQLGRLTAMDPSTISIVVRKLLKNGLVVRLNAAHDQRLSIIRLTKKGIDYTLPLLGLSMDVGRRVLQPLNRNEQKVFMALLRRVADAGTDRQGES